MSVLADPPIDSSYLELAYSPIRIFADDGTVDTEELGFLLGIALRDNQIDDEEKRVLRNIFEQGREDEIEQSRCHTDPRDSSTLLDLIACNWGSLAGMRKRFEPDF